MGFLLHGFCPRFLSSPACNLPAPCLHPTCMLPSFCRCAACTIPNLYVRFTSSLPAACALLALCLHFARTLPAHYPCAACALRHCLRWEGSGALRSPCGGQGQQSPACPAAPGACPGSAACGTVNAGSFGIVALPLPGSFSVKRSLRQPMRLEDPSFCPDLPGGAGAAGCRGPSLL